MRTEVLSILSDTALETAGACLMQHQVIAAPTDTVYGVMCRWDSPQAIAQLYAVKERPPDKAIPILIGALDQLELFIEPPLPPVALALIERFWPGPLTLVVRARAGLPPILTAGQPSIAVRMPDHEHLLRLLRAVGALAATSANLSGQDECHDVDAVLQQLDGRLPLVLADTPVENQPTSAEPSQRSAASTIIDLSQLETDGPRLLRAGPIGAEVCELLDESFGHRC